MASVQINVIGASEYELLCSLYNVIFRPSVDTAFFQQRLDERRDAISLVADLEGKPVGFACGYELRPSTFYVWLCGVLPDARRLGVASQLMDATHAKAREHGYEMVRFECHNQARPMLHVAIRDGYDIVGIRWDSRSASNLVIMEKNLPEHG